jgi:hypothetical protein
MDNRVPIKMCCSKISKDVTTKVNDSQQDTHIYHVWYGELDVSNYSNRLDISSH